jgi:TRAP-type C4-dicarboxylate transport system permease small subunit
MSLVHFERILERGLRALALCGGVVLLGLVGLVVYEVTMRYFFSLPFMGSYEMTELGMALIVASALPYCALTGGHVAVDIFARYLDRPGMRWLNVLIHSIGAVLMGAIAFLTVEHAIGSYQWGDMSNMMRIPKYPFQLATALGAALFALVLVLAAIKAWTGPDRAADRASEQ